MYIFLFSFDQKLYLFFIFQFLSFKKEKRKLFENNKNKKLFINHVSATKKILFLV